VPERHPALPGARKGVLDGDLPHADGADGDRVARLGDEVARGWRQAGVVGDGPEGDVDAEKEVQSPSPANRRAMIPSAPAMSCGASNRPLATPIRRPAGLAARGASRAAGLPLRAMTISASRPLSTASI
jgi:hypothetical protein